MDCCNRDMRRVNDSFLRQGGGGFQSNRQIDDLVGKRPSMNNVYKFVGFPEKDGAGYWLFVS